MEEIPSPNLLQAVSVKQNYVTHSFAGSPQLPKFYIAFESTLPGDTSKVPYDRGEDGQGNKNVILGNNALIGASERRSGKVLKLKGVNAGAIIGDVKPYSIK